MYFKQRMHPVSWKIINLTDFQYVSKVCFVFLYGYIYSSTCQTVVSDLLFWYSGPDFVVFEEPEEAVGEPQRLVEWQTNNVI